MCAGLVFGDRFVKTELSVATGCYKDQNNPGGFLYSSCLFVVENGERLRVEESDSRCGSAQKLLRHLEGRVGSALKHD